MKKVLHFLVKMMLSGLLALAILSVFCYFYDNVPSAVEQPLGITNFRYPPSVFWSDMTEGFGFGWMDSLGYNNPQDMAEDTGPFIAFLGSSHTEAFQVMPDQSFAALTQALLAADADAENDYPCLNLGASSHYLTVTVSHIGTIADAFPDMKYAVIEANELQYSPEELQKMLQGGYHAPLKKEGMLSRLLEKVPVLKLPFLRTLKKQLDRVERMNESASETVSAPVDYAAYQTALEPVLAKIAATAEQGGFQAIIVYHHNMELDDRLGLIRIDDPQIVQIFTESCNRHGIRFLDMTDTFIAHYRAYRETPNGFMNTAMSAGHLNAVGHRLIAEAVYQQICQLGEVQ